MKKKIIALFMATMLVGSLMGCGGSTQDSSSSNNTENQSVQGDQIIIKVFSNLPDRTTGQGFVEQALFDQYMSENPNIKIEVEALSDEAYKTKFKAYASGSDMPDLVNAWGQPSFLNEIIDAGILEPLNTENYTDYGFISGSLDGFSKDGILYGLPRNTDVMGFYYNKAIFKENGWSIPNTYDELIALSQEVLETGMIPVSMDGSSKWPLSIFIHDLMQKIDPSIKQEVYSSIENGDFSNPVYTQASELFLEAVDAKMFQSGFETTDYGTAKNLFTNGQAAMFYMGSWEMSMATDENVPQDIRDNIGVFMMPSVNGGKGSVTDIAAWNGGGYAVSANSKVKEEALKLLNYMFLPENWTKLCWENGICMSAQDFSNFLTGEETPVQLEYTQVVSDATSMSGVTFNDLGTAEFKTISEDLSQLLAIKSVTVEQFLSQLEDVNK